jgi:hypothetical protein
LLNGTAQTVTSARGVESDSADPILGIWLAIVAAVVLVIVAIGWKCRFHGGKRWANRAVEPKSETAASSAAESIQVNVDTLHNHEDAYSERMPLEPLAPLSMVRMGDENSFSVNRREDNIPLDHMPALLARTLEPPGRQLLSVECPYKDQFGDHEHAPSEVCVARSCPYKDQFGNSFHMPDRQNN